jgi:hypothetical protein
LSDTAAEAEPEGLQRARAIGGRLVQLQIALALVGGVAVLLIDSSSEWVAYVAAGLLLGLEVAGWAVARSALLRAAPVSRAQLLAAVPLTPNERRLVAVNVFVALAALAFLLTLDRRYAALGGAIMAVSVLSFLRVWRGNSWLAISWVPARPRVDRSAN